MLVHGLRFPLPGSWDGTQVPGVSGTRHCDWWFSDEAVLLDTAGRYTTQDSDPDSDREAWLGFPLDLLPAPAAQPLGSVLLTVAS